MRGVYDGNPRGGSRILPVAVLLLAASCAEPPPEPAVLRLTDLFPSATLQGAATAPPEIPRTEWRFDAGAAGWEAAQQVTGLVADGGVLRGRTTGVFPVLHVEREADVRDPDVLYSVEVRMRVSAGSRLELAFVGTEEVDVGWMSSILFDWPVTSPVVPGEERRTYVIRPHGVEVPARDVRHVLLRPTDADGADFEIESVRIVFRREHLAEVPAGLGWHGFGEIYRETVVTRVPESVVYSLKLPSRPRLDLALAKADRTPVTFRVEVGSETLLRRRITATERWEPVVVDLSKLAGREVKLKLTAEGEDGTIAFWGSPAVRNLGAGPGSPRGVILVVADTLRADHLDAYGYERRTAPILSRLAAEGVLFEDCVAQATWTKVSVPSILTSLYPDAHGVSDFADRLPSSALTLAEIFREAGYATLSLSSILFTGRYTNLQQGFEVLHEDGSLRGERRIKSAWQYVGRLLPWLEANREVPFFVLLHVTDPHDPYEPNIPYDRIWTEPGGKGAFEAWQQQAKRFIRDPLMRNYRMPTRDELDAAGVDPAAYVAQEVDWYDGSIRGMDAELGRLMDGLAKLGLAETTLVAVVGDHGEEFLEHGRHWHGQSVYGELTHVPWILWGPGVPPGRRVEETVETVDLLPTLLEFAGLPVPETVQGVGLRALVLGRGERRRPAVTVKAAVTNAAGPPPRNKASAAIVDGGWKLIHNTVRESGEPEYELYDHRGDPLNANDVAAQHPDVVARLTERLEAWRRYVEAHRLTGDDEAAERLSAEELERLRSLGYID